VALGFGFFFLFLASFVVFLVLTFPYEVFKETLAAELSQMSGQVIRIGDLRASLPIGLTAKDVHVETRTGAALTIDQLAVDVSVLNLLVGRVRVNAEVEQGDGDLDATADFGLFDLIGQRFVPRRIQLKASAFPIDGPASFGLKYAAGLPSMAVAGALLGAISFTGKLNGEVDLDLDTKAPSQSTGAAELTLGGAVLKLSDPSIGLPDQAFTKALIKAKVDGGALVIDKNSGFVSDELLLAAEGRIDLAADLFLSKLGVKVTFKLDKGLKEKFAWIMDMMTAPGSDGQVTMHVRGTIGAANVTTGA
jgi:autotransporter translocation and assembly factor TamB